MEYSTDVPTVANIGGLLVFDTLANCTMFVISMGISGNDYFDSPLERGYGMFQCQCEQPVPVPARRLVSPSLIESLNTSCQLNVIWSGARGEDIDCQLDGANLSSRWPTGTLAFKKVQLVGNVILWSDAWHAFNTSLDGKKLYED